MKFAKEPSLREGEIGRQHIERLKKLKPCKPCKTPFRARHKFSLPWSFRRIVCFINYHSRSYSEDTIGRAKISPHKVLCVIRLFSKPDVIHCTASYHGVPYAWFESRVGSAWICHERFVRVHTGYRLVQPKVLVWVCEGFCTKLHDRCICDIELVYQYK